MSERIRGAIEELQMQVRQLEEEASKIKDAVNLLCRREGIPIIYADSGTRSTDSQMNSDTFYGQSINTAIRMFLEMRKASSQGPASVRAIYEGLAQGGFEFNTKNSDNAMRMLRISLNKSTNTFHRLPNGEYGLLKWYPNAKQKQRQAEISAQGERRPVDPDMLELEEETEIADMDDTEKKEPNIKIN